MEIGERGSSADLGLGRVATSDLILELNRRFQELAHEEARIKELGDRICALTRDPGDVIDINAGGQIHSVRRDTLLVAKGSVLASLFSGNWDDGLVRDSQGRPFLEIDPYIFGKIINYLRQKLIEGPDTPAPLPVIDADRVLEYDRVVDYYGLTELLRPHRPMAVHVQSLCRPGQVMFKADAVPRGYLFRTSQPVALKAVLVGLGGTRGDTTNARIIVSDGGATGGTVYEAPLEVFVEAPLHWDVPDPEMTHCAYFNDIIIPAVGPSNTDFTIMVSSRGFLNKKYVQGDDNVHAVGPFQVASKADLPPDGNRNNVCMSLVYTWLDLPD